MSGLLPGATAASELCMLATPYDAELHPKRAIVQQKWDGIRCLWLNGDPYTREGQPMHCVEHLRPEIRQLQREFGKAMFFDSEFVAGSFEQTLACMRSKGCDGLIHLFDAVPFDAWANAGRTAKLGDRIEMLQTVPVGPFPHIQIEHDMTNGICTGPVETEALFHRVTRKGGEGIIVKDADGAYFRGQSRQWMKRKRLDTVDGKLVGIWTTNGSLRSMEVLTAAGELVKLGSGWNPHGPFPAGLTPGCTVEWAHNGRTSTGKPRHARFVRVKDHKGDVK